MEKAVQDIYCVYVCVSVVFVYVSDESRQLNPSACSAVYGDRAPVRPKRHGRVCAYVCVCLHVSNEERQVCGSPSAPHWPLAVAEMAVPPHGHLSPF